MKVAANILKISLCLNVVLFAALALTSRGAKREAVDAELGAKSIDHGTHESGQTDQIESPPPTDPARPSAVPVPPDIWVHVRAEAVENIRVTEKGGAVSDEVLRNLNLTESETEQLQRDVQAIYEEVVAQQTEAVTKESDDVYVIEGLPDEIEGHAATLRESFEKVTSPEIAAFLTDAVVKGGFLGAMGKRKTITFEWRGRVGAVGSYEVMKVANSTGYYNIFLDGPRGSAQNRERLAPLYEILGLGEEEDGGDE